MLYISVDKDCILLRLALMSNVIKLYLKSKTPFLFVLTSCKKCGDGVMKAFDQSF